jgi:hypothetical protein
MLPFQRLLEKVGAAPPPVATPYPRWTDLAFLERCDPKVAQFYRYWDCKRGGRAMPSRSDIHPVEIPSFLPGIVLVDVFRDPLHLVYRLVGTREVAYRGNDPTGKDVATHYFGSSRDEVMRNYQLVIDRRSFVYDEDWCMSPVSTMREAGTILLPLSADDAEVDMVLIYNHYHRG